MKIFLIALISLVPSVVALAEPNPGGNEADWVFRLWQELSDRGAALISPESAYDGKKQYYAASSNQLANCPEWDENAEPQLSLGAAVKLARSHLATLHPKRDTFPFAARQLLTFGNESYSNRWCYALDFVALPSSSTNSLTGKPVNIVFDEDSEIPNAIDQYSPRDINTLRRVYVMGDGSIVEPTPIRRESANNPSHHTTESRAEAQLPAAGER